MSARISVTESFSVGLADFQEIFSFIHPRLVAFVSLPVIHRYNIAYTLTSTRTQNNLDLCRAYLRILPGANDTDFCQVMCNDLRKEPAFTILAYHIIHIHPVIYFRNDKKKFAIVIIVK